MPPKLDPSLPRQPIRNPGQRPGAAPQPRLRIGIVLARRFTLCALANFVDVLRLAADEGDRSRPILCSWKLIAADMTPIESSCGVTVQPEEKPGNPSQFDYVAVIGGVMGDPQPLHPALVAYLQRAAQAGVPLIGICTGAFILHRAGLMQGYRCCVSWFHHEDFRQEFEGLIPVSDRIFVVDRDRLTCSGGASSAQLAAWLVERHIGRAAARKSLAIMIFDPDADSDPAERPQPGLPMELRSNDPLVRRALLRIQQSLDSPLPVARLAAQLEVGRRKLERHFAAELGLSPSEAARRIRLAEARRLLATGSDSITEIALATGFCDASHLIRTFREAEGISPEAWRRAHVAEPAPDPR